VAGRGLQRNRLGVVAIAAIVISAVAPVSVMAAASPVVFAVHGAATPATFALAGSLFAVFAVGYVAMSRHMSNAGGFVAYIARGLGTRAATAAAAVTLLFYLASLVSFYAISGVVAAFTFGLEDSSALVTFAALAIVGVLGYFGVTISIGILVVLLGLEILAVLVVDVAVLFQGGPDGFSLEGFTPSAITGPGLGVALLLCIIGYSGLEATVVFSEEAKQPRRTIPRAVYAALAFIAVFYTVSTWLVSVGAGVSTVQEQAAADPASFFFAVADQVVGGTFTRILEILVVSSFLALFIGFQSLIARYVFALGRAGLLPAVLGTTDRRRHNPVAASLTVTAVLALVLGAFTVAGADPVAVTYSWLVGLGTVGLLVVLIVVSVSIIAFFARTPVERSPWSTKIAPALATLGLGTALVLALQNYAFLGALDERAIWLLLLIPIAAAGGWVLAGSRSRRGLDTDYSADLGA
jgi:amino acid transporter